MKSRICFKSLVEIPLRYKTGLEFSDKDFLVKIFLKKSLDAERMTLWALRFSEYVSSSSSSVVRVQSKNCLSSRMLAKERNTFPPKSFHRKQNFSIDPILVNCLFCLRDAIMFGNFL